MKNKLLILTTSFPRWKDDTYPSWIYELAKTLFKKGFRINILSPHYPKAKIYEERDNLKIKRFRYFYPLKYQKLGYGILPNIKKNKFLILQVLFFNISYLINSIKIAKKEKIDIVNTQWIIPSGIIGAILKKLYGIKHICTIHAGGILMLNRLPFRKTITKFIAKNTDYFVIVSTHGKEMLLNTVPSNLKESVKNKIKIISMGIYTKNFKYIKDKNKLRERNNIKSKHVLLFVGRLAGKKGVKYLLKSMPEIIKKLKDVELLIMGDGPLKEDILKLTKKLKLEKKVKFLGYVVGKKRNEYLSLSDILIIPSIVTKEGDTEGLPVVIMEGMATGLPIITTNVGGIKDIIKNNQNGILIQEKNSKQIAENVIKLINNKKFMEKLSKNALLTSKNYDWDIIGEKNKNLLK